MDTQGRQGSQSALLNPLASASLHFCSLVLPHLCDILLVGIAELLRCDRKDWQLRVSEPEIVHLLLLAKSYALKFKSGCVVM